MKVSKLYHYYFALYLLHPYEAVFPFLRTGWMLSVEGTSENSAGPHP